MNYSISILSMQVKEQHHSEQHYESNITQMNHQQNSTTTVNGQYQVSAIFGPINKAIIFDRLSSPRKKRDKDTYVNQTFMALFVFSIVGPKQNAGSLLAPVSDTVFYALSHGTLGFSLHMVAFSTIFWLVKILQQPIRFFDINGYWSCHGKQNRGYHVKEHKNYIRNWCQKWSCILFGAIYRENKRC